jgi:hypothetical protein
MIIIEDYKEEPINENLADDEFISRLTGLVTKKNGRKTILESIKDGEELSDDIAKSFLVVGECFRMNDQSDPGMVKYLYNEWSFPKNVIDIVFNEMGYSFDETQKFLIRMSGSDDTDQERMKESWDKYCDDNDIHTGPSTEEFTNFML